MTTIAPETAVPQTPRAAPWMPSPPLTLPGFGDAGPSWPNPLGHAADFRRDPLELMLRAQRQHGDVVRLRVGPVLLHFVFDPEIAREILLLDHTRYSKRTRGYDALRMLLGNGLVTSEGSFWRRQRRIAQPAFQRKRIAQLAGLMQQAASDLAETWQPLADGRQEVDVAQAMMNVTLRIAGETLFGVDLSDGSAEVGAAVTDMLHHFQRVFTGLLPLSIQLPTPANRRGRKAMATMDKVVFDIIAERRRSGGEEELDLLGMFMGARDEETGESMTDVQLRDEVLTMLLAGHETTANALSWTFYLLSKHPLVLRRMQRELDEVTGGAAPTLEQLRALPYCDQVLSESMRLYPPVWALARKAEQDDVLGGYHIPKGSYVVFSPYCIHRNVAHWPNPEGFDPDRFAPERLAAERSLGRSKHAYLPFAAGPRKCIGDHFAKMEAMIVLATLLGRFEPALVPHHPVVPEPSVTLRPRDGILMTLKQR